MRTRSNSYGKKRIKVKDIDFEIPEKDSYLSFLDYDYNIKQLKLILKSYNLKISGNKNELNQRIFNFIKSNFFSKIIQKNVRGFFIRKFYRIKQKYKFDKNIEYNNDSDFYTMEKIHSINPLYILSYKDKNNFNWIFKITSLIKHFDNTTFFNPFNREVFSNKIIEDTITIKNIYKIYPTLCEEDHEEELILSRKQKIIFKINAFFQLIDSLGNYSDAKWLLELNKRQLVIFIRELYDIWNYRAQLTDDVKKTICPLSGTPFVNININVLNRHTEYLILLDTCCIIFSNLLNTTADNSNKSIGALYILSALTLVSNKAADTLPWLYQSVI